MYIGGEDMREIGSKARAIESDDHGYFNGEVITLLDSGIDLGDSVELWSFINDKKLDQLLEVHEFEWLN